MPEYRAVSFKSSDEAPEVVLFAAPADEIDSWNQECLSAS